MELGTAAVVATVDSPLVGLSEFLDTSVVVMVGRLLDLDVLLLLLLLLLLFIEFVVGVVVVGGDFVVVVVVVVVEVVVGAVVVVAVALWLSLKMLAVESALRGGRRSFTLSRVLASSNEICFWSRVSEPIITLAKRVVGFNGR